MAIWLRVVVHGFLLIVLSARLSLPFWPQKAARLSSVTGNIATGADSGERRRAITRQLESAGIDFRLEEFVDSKMRQGTNIVATVPATTPGGNSILAGAHYDRVAIGQGALDNAASCAVLVDLLETFKTRPLKTHSLVVVFFDLEEVGLSGSQSFFESARNQTLPVFALNLDVFAYGNAIFSTASKPGGPLVNALQSAGSELGIPVRVVPLEQYPGSDHISMIAAGVETVSVSLLDEPEIDAIVGLITRQTTVVPPVLGTIHTPKDSMDVVQPPQMEKAIPLLEKTIRALDN